MKNKTNWKIDQNMMSVYRLAEEYRDVEVN